MEEDQEENFRKLIQTAVTEQPAEGFTGEVMKMVHMETEADFTRKTVFSGLLQSHKLLESPSLNFDKNVLSMITPVLKTKPAPVITRQAWYIIAASVGLILIACLFAVSPVAVNQAESRADLLLSGISGKLDSLPVIYPATLIAMSILVVADYFLRQKLNQRHLSF